MSGSTPAIIALHEAAHAVAAVVLHWPLYRVTIEPRRGVLGRTYPGGKPIADPGGVAGALRWDVPGTIRGSAGTWELVVQPQSKTVLHWLFTSKPKGTP